MGKFVDLLTKGSQDVLSATLTMNANSKANPPVSTTNVSNVNPAIQQPVHQMDRQPASKVKRIVKTAVNGEPVKVGQSVKTVNVASQINASPPVQIPPLVRMVRTNVPPLVLNSPANIRSA
tara:strand:+ start:808 stop:1170 length:363 start_codon:yes stop_codon:yes gene_type:complete